MKKLKTLLVLSILTAFVMVMTTQKTSANPSRLHKTKGFVIKGEHIVYCVGIGDYTCYFAIPEVL